MGKKRSRLLVAEMYEILKDSFTELRMLHFWMKLETVERFFLMSDGLYLTIVTFCQIDEIFW